MIFRFKCDRCKKEITTGKESLKVTQRVPYKQIGDLCFDCWALIKTDFIDDDSNKGVALDLEDKE